MGDETAAHDQSARRMAFLPRAPLGDGLGGFFSRGGQKGAGVDEVAGRLVRVQRQRGPGSEKGSRHHLGVDQILRTAERNHKEFFRGRPLVSFGRHLMKKHSKTEHENKSTL